MKEQIQEANTRANTNKKESNDKLEILNNYISVLVSLCLYCMKTQVFIDGNKRASIIFANHYMIQNGEGLLVVPESEVDQFKSLLIAYYEGRDEKRMKQFLKDRCWRRF